MKLGNVIANHRWAAKMASRDLAREIGIPPATLNRVERGEQCDAASLIKIMLWLFGSNDSGAVEQPHDAPPREAPTPSAS